MDIKLLTAYSKTNGIAASKSKAKSLHPTLVHASPDYAVYSYKGSEKEPYNIKILFKNNSVGSSCTCPYDAGGICKHVIAAITHLVSELKKGTVLMLSDEEYKIVKQLAPNEILLPNGIINRATIASIKYVRVFGWGHVKLTKVSTNLVEIKSANYNNIAQVISFTPETNILQINCNCSKRLDMCEHAAMALYVITEKLGADYFTPNYYTNALKKLVKESGLSADEYNKIYTSELSTEGVVSVSKFKNIQKNIEEIIPIFNTERGILKALQPVKKTVDPEYGLTFCIKIYNNTTFRTISPFYAKYNRVRNDFSSSFNIITTNDLTQAFTTFKQKNEQDLIIKTIQIDNLLGKFNDNNNANYIKDAQFYFSEIAPLLATELLYKGDIYNSITRKNLTPITVDITNVELYFTLIKNDLFYTLNAKLRIHNTSYNVDDTDVIINPVFVIIKDVIHPIPNLQTALYIIHYANGAEVNYHIKDFDIAYQKVLLPLSRNYKIESDVFKKSQTKQVEQVLEKHIYISDFEGEHIVFKPAVQYNGKLISVFSNELLIESSTNNEIIYSERDDAFEDSFIEEFKSLHPAFGEQEGICFLTPDQLMENYWMLHATDKMQEMGIKVYGANTLKSFKFNVNKPIISIGLKSDIDWFDLEIDIKFGTQKVDIKELQKAFVKKTNYVALGDGTLGILPEEWMKKFANYFKVGEIKKGGIKLSNYQFGIIDELYNEIESRPPFLIELYEKKKRLQNITEIEPVKIPKGITATLRDYQHHGLNWLAFLDKNQLGGCLADDMGLGKTLQAITFLQYLKTTQKNKAPSLIIAPTSLIFNWRNEIEKFCPSLKLLSFVGSARAENKDNFNNYDLIISTYGSLLNDVEFMKDTKFHYIILDESQAIKNPNSKRYKAVRLLNSYNRLVLTGTPIENNTFDLYAQMNFINPGLLGNMSRFKNEFSDAIDKEKNHDASHLLGKMISPFLLRRTKEQVAKELPEKTESIIYCEMDKEQRKVYDTFKNKYRDYLLNKIDENGVENAQMYILEGLTKLRQICNSTALIPGEEDYGNHSVKLDLLIENIKEKTGNHKILVFSQFVQMLQLIKGRLDNENIHYEYLDGQTTDRQARVENFQNNSNVRVFLISLKAGGTGLNLTEADYVFLVDPWWNPAVENQAIDRCYRIGQTRKVMAYRMICRDTIEEKIASLQTKKKKVASSIIAVDEEKKSFDVAQVKSFFS
jgi:SNF2 family DNA or RNA helicase